MMKLTAAYLKFSFFDIPSSIFLAILNKAAIAALYAARNNPKEVELLLSKGADIKAKDNDGNTALTYAMDNVQSQIVELLRKHGAKE